MIYPTKKDIWLVFIVAIGGFGLIVQAINLIIVKGFHYPQTWILFAASVFYFGILVLFAYPVNYEITTSTLEIRSGILLHYKIPLSSIESVVPTRNPLSSPAWSLDRLRIDYLKNNKKRVIMISPKDKKTFIRELIERTPSLKLDGNVVMRT
ncbi:MAG TPA: PH domain-containing protein [Thermodesulfovibrionales bacterium]|nr:PH domain-containing protein [Thermodesulfovibrionales bacterium]